MGAGPGRKAGGVKVCIVLVEGPGHVLELAQGQPQGQRNSQVRGQRRVGLQRGVQPGFPSIVELQAGRDLVGGVEPRRKARLQRPLVEQQGGEGVKRPYRSLVQVGEALAAALPAGPILRGLRLFFQPLPDTVPQLRRGRLGEGDGRDPVQGGPALCHQVDRTGNQAVGLARAGAGLDEQGFSKLRLNDIACFPIARPETFRGRDSGGRSLDHSIPLLRRCPVVHRPTVAGRSPAAGRFSCVPRCRPGGRDRVSRSRRTCNSPALPGLPGSPG